MTVYFFDSPGSMSIHEESTLASQGPMMGVFNNLVMYEQDVPQTSLQSIVPDLATEWSRDEDKTELIFRLRQGIRWHNGQPFTAKDVKCTCDLLAGKASEKLRLNPRKAWYRNLEDVTTSGDFEVTFHLKRPPPFIALLASGYSPVYPCQRVTARHAPASNWHRPVQIRRVQAKRIHQGDEECRLLEERPPVSRRHRLHDHRKRVDGDLGVRLER